MGQRKTAVSVFSSVLMGVDARLVEVQADLRPGMVRTHIVGLPDKACTEARERIKGALRNSGFRLPRGVLTMNLAPAELPKYGAGLDLAMAIAMLARMGVVAGDAIKRGLFLGELALDGSLRSVSGVLAAAELARKQSFEFIVVPAANVSEAALVEGIRVWLAEDLLQVVDHLQGRLLPGTPTSSVLLTPPAYDVDFSHIHGHALAKQALEIAAAGSHNMLMCGPPGSGKTLLAQSIVSILPTMQPSEIVEVAKVYSAAGLHDQTVLGRRPWRSPHHTTSIASLAGGGNIPRPGEISLAHRGVLFLDEFPEFSRSVLETLRQPLECGTISVSRSRHTVEFPARFLLIAAMNPCPCGFASDPDKQCVCAPAMVQRYHHKLSGPLLDRFDLFLEVPRQPPTEFFSGSVDSSRGIRERVQQAQCLQLERYKPIGILTNDELSAQHLFSYAKIDARAHEFLARAATHMQYSHRAYFRILRIARTIADLAGHEFVLPDHIAEALQFRMAKFNIAHLRL